MNILYDIGDLAGIGGPACLAIGVFDGVHRGHQALIRAVQDAARQRSALPVVVTFEPHPLKVLRPDNAPAILTSLDHKLVLLGRLGAKHVLVIRFDEAFSRTPPEDFIRSLVAACQPLRLIGVGFRWEFGHRRAGNVSLIEHLGTECDFDVLELPPVTEDHDHISSTRVRQAITDGNLEQAARLLGRPFSIFGAVVHGEHLGHQLGFPTANLDVEGEKLPPDGVYAGTCDIGGQTHPVAINIGTRPTLGGTERRVEAHIIGFDGDLYGQRIEVPLLKFLRPETRFDNLDALRAQIARDVEATKTAAKG
ncbi:MAG TPA: bifunctional riboflavin kinase/FAD synthetase [Verrucomicrobiae bacterium]|nr:bifunctional riboflavin kinase/FAD synthetase [Verrucomicrobiae bacterium]